MTHVLALHRGHRTSSSSTWTSRTLRRIRHSMHRSRYSTALLSTILTLYSLTLCLLSLPLLTTPLPPTIHPTTHTADEPHTPLPHLPLHQPIHRLSPCYGVYELKGRRHYMEDTHAVLGYGQLTTSRMAASSDFAAQVEASEEGKRGESDSEVEGSGWLLFGVFDGHGGPDASAYTATHLLSLLHSRLTAYEQHHTSALPSPPDSQPTTTRECSNQPADATDTTALASTVSTLCTTTTAKQSAVDTLPSSPSLLPPHHNLTAAFTSSYHTVDEAYRSHPLAHHHRHKHSDGSTALVAAVNVARGQVVVSNAGDCRAIVIAEETGEGKALVQRDKARRVLRWLCGGRGDGDEGGCASDSEDEEDDSEGGMGVVSDESDEDDELDEKTPAVTEAELMDMYHHFHPALPATPTSTATPPQLSDTPLFLPLSVDHKPHLPLERSYIQSHPSGYITQSRHNGISRVQGILATSRAIGDYELRPHVRCEPDVVGWQYDNSGSGASGGSMGRWLLLGSDGLFDVWSNVGVAQWVREQAGRGLSVQRMAKELVMAAYRMGSEDNISALIVDLQCLQATQAQVRHSEHSESSEH